MASEGIKNVYRVYKEWGETPLVCLERLRASEGIDASVPMTYAGRLDPAAEGELIILVGEECKNKDAYSGLSKTYVAEIIFSVSTDTYDLLGIPSTCAEISKHSFEEGLSQALGAEKLAREHARRVAFSKECLEISAHVEAFLKKMIGKFQQQYPAYSSKTVDGIQLHTHARAGNEVLLPKHDVELISYTDLTVGSRTRAEVLDRVQKLTSIVQGDFRQAEILETWTQCARDLPDELLTVKVELTVSSGFYVRQFAHDIGQAFGIEACLYSLVRTHIEE